MSLKYYNLDRDPYEDLALTEDDMERIIKAINENNTDEISLEEINYVLNLLYDQVASDLQTVDGSLVLQ